MTTTATTRRRRTPAGVPAEVPRVTLPAWVDGLNLTPAERRVVQYVHDFRSANAAGPTFAEIAAAFGLSRVSVFQAAHAAAVKGALLVDRGRNRSLRLAAGPDDPAAGRADRLAAELAAVRELAGRAASVMRLYAGMWDGDARARGSGEEACGLRREMRHLAERIKEVLSPGGPGDGRAQCRQP